MAGKNQDIKARLLATFRVEAEEHLQAITANLLALDRGLPPAEASGLVEATFREVHTLKGAARSVSLMDVEALCQALESLLSRMTRGHLPLSRPLLQRLQEGIDRVARLLAGGEAPADLRELINRLEHAGDDPAAGGAEAVPAERPPAEVHSAPAAAWLHAADTIRLPTAKLDTLLFQAEELLAPKLAAAERAREARALVEALSRSRVPQNRTRTGRRSGDADGPAVGLLAGLDSGLRGLEAQARELAGHLARDERMIRGALDSLQEEMRRLRMMPASTVLDLFPRMVQDLARERGKEVEWVAGGADPEVDRRVLETMKAPLIHLVRNAVDHGIESPEVRAAAGKPARGRVAAIIAPLEGNRIEIRVEDDGCGIDLAEVKAAAIRAHLVTAEESQALTEEEALGLVYRSGLSTSSIITDVSGHGLGLAIVKERVEQLGGQIHLENRPRAGTTVRMVLPATIATFRGLRVQAGGQSFLLPTEAVERAIRIAAEDVERVEGREAIRWNGHPLAVAELAGLLGLPKRADPPEAQSKQPCVIVRAGEERVGFLVEEILGDQEVLVKGLGAPLVRVRNVAGAGLLGTGQVVLILRPADLLRSVRERPGPPVSAAGPGDEARQKVVLVVDDSITTRTMEKNLLETAGYQVRLAVDGVEAWTLVKSEEFDLVLSDVDMPRLDGFELTARIRADRKLAELPVVLVTALESREDKERGIEVGANAYIIKSSFDQSNLLEIIRRLV
ncbi:MAG TPA: response regulator [Candidatus Methylomirabilis sp.]|jgi:two-component system chemotaxis sensor kinase CheA|nr:response regulator [Candidatus Methylomirabilis sp.]